VKKYAGEFKDFIDKGDVITIAVGLVMALYFQKIVNAILEGVINPIISAIFGKQNFTEIGFDIGDARISIGLVIDAVISFIVVAIFLFLVIKAYNNFKAKAPEAPPEPSPEVTLLEEIRDELRAGRPQP
jgi:large conductance mechanosensitive channel